MRCERCGSILPNHSIFCENCGARQHAQTEPYRTAESSGTIKPKNKKRSKRAMRAQRILNAFFIGGAAIAVAAFLLGINFFIKAKTMRAISSADDLVTSALAEYIDSTGAVTAENSEAALSAVYQHAIDAVSNGTFESAEKNDNCVTIGLPGGGYYVYLISNEATDASAFTLNDSNQMHNIQEDSREISTENAATSPGNIVLAAQNNSADANKYQLRIATIQPYCKETQNTHPTQWIYPDMAAENIAANLATYSYFDNGTLADDNRDDAEVSINYLKSLSEYAVVIWHGHGGYSSGIGSFLGTTNAYSNQYINDLRKGRVVRLNDGGMAVTSAFFDKYLQKNNNYNSLIYLGTCLSGKDSRLADAFLEKGFDCVVVNSDKIERTYNLNIMKAFFDGMSARTGELLSAQEALENAKLIYGDYDQYSSYQAVPILQGDATLRFAAGEQMPMSAVPVATDAPYTVPVAAWAQAYADVLSMEQVGNSDGMFSPKVFSLLDMNGDGVPELIVAEMDGNKAEELVFTPNEVGAGISQYAIYTYKDSEAVCIDTELISYANNIFMIYNNRNIISGDAGTGYLGYAFLDYTENQFRTYRLATVWNEIQDETYYQFGEVSNDQKNDDSPSVPEISEEEYNTKYDDFFSNTTLPIFYDNTAELRSQVLGIQ